MKRNDLRKLAKELQTHGKPFAVVFRPNDRHPEIYYFKTADDANFYAFRHTHKTRAIVINLEE
jgi:hypothetical protein